MTSVLFFSMVSAFVAGLCCFALGSLVRLRESWRRVLFFLGCMIGFWVSSVVLLADDVADAFSEVQIGMEEAVANAFHQYGLRTGLVAEAGEMPPLPHGRGAPRLCVPADLARPSLTAGSSLPADCALAFGVNLSVQFLQLGGKFFARGLRLRPGACGVRRGRLAALRG